MPRDLLPHQLDRVVDERWMHALDGLPCIAFVYRPQDQRPPDRSMGEFKPRKTALPLPGEVTGVEGHYVYVVLDDEQEPRRLFWTDVRPA